MKKLYFIFFLIIVFGVTQNSQAQIFDKLKKKTEEKIKREAEERATDKINKGVEKGFDEAEQTVEGENKEEQKTENKTEGVKDNKSDTNTPEETKENIITSKYDFIAGERVIFFDDFSQDAVGDFPLLWNTNGSAEVVNTSLYPGNWMKFITRETIWTDELLDLPENYTIEFDVVPLKGIEGRMAGFHFRLMQAINVKAWDAGSRPGKAAFVFNIEASGRPTYSTYINGNEGKGLELGGYIDDRKLALKMDQKYHIAIWKQKSRIRLYVNENKLIDLPKAFPVASVKMDRIRFEDGAAMISNVRFAVGNPDMRSKLITEGKLVTYGIYFDVNKDIVKSESYGTLKEIAKVLTDNPDVKVKIVGHTDSDGNDKSNMDLSIRRGASVKNFLVDNFGIDAARLESDGKGESVPVAPNDNATNKALNRRVEFIKI